MSSPYANYLIQHTYQRQKWGLPQNINCRVPTENKLFEMTAGVPNFLHKQHLHSYCHECHLSFKHYYADPFSEIFIFGFFSINNFQCGVLSIFYSRRLEKSNRIELYIILKLSMSPLLESSFIWKSISGDFFFVWFCDAGSQMSKNELAQIYWSSYK